MAISDDDYVIIGMSANDLGKMTSDGRFRWNGTNRYASDCYHVGIFDVESHCKKGDVDISYDTNPGWGFGNLCWIASTQTWSWNRKVLPVTAFEISVKSEELTSDEAQHLLKDGER